MALKIQAVDASNPDPQIIKEAARLISKGEVVVCPTDSGYAFTANALDSKAITKVFALKGRLYSNPIHVAVSSIEKAEKYACVNKAAECLARRFLPGALTLVLYKKEIIPSLLVGGRNTVGVRIPDNKVILDLTEVTNLPLTATSANISGTGTPYAVQEIIDQLGNSMEKIALVLDQGPLIPIGTSTVVDLTVMPPQILRHGPVNKQDILEALLLVQNLE